MTSINEARARAVADLAEGLILASVDVAASPERVFRALASKEITEWWVRPGVFDTREWSGDVRPGGRWRASGMTRGEPYVQEGEFLEVESPRRLVHTWERAGKAGVASTVTYLVEPIDEQVYRRYKTVPVDVVNDPYRTPHMVVHVFDTVFTSVMLFLRKLPTA